MNGMSNLGGVMRVSRDHHRYYYMYMDGESINCAMVSGQLQIIFDISFSAVAAAALMVLVD